MNFRSHNQIIGEIAGLITLVSYGASCLNHFFHHKHPDTEDDPHCPINISFLKFAMLAPFSGTKVIRENFYLIHKKNFETFVIFHTSLLFHFISIFLKVILLFILIGKNAFILYFIPAYLVYIYVFVDVNYSTHVLDKKDNKIKILNLNESYLQKYVNWVGLGIYFHKNHHLNKKMVNPKYLNKLLS